MTASSRPAAEHGLNVLMTRADHPSGTDRLAEVVALRDWADDAIVVNVQGDEPLIDPDAIAGAARQLAASGADIATLAHGIEDAADFFNPNVVKVVCRENGDASTFPGRRFSYARDHFAREAGGETLPSSFPLSATSGSMPTAPVSESVCGIDAFSAGEFRGARAVTGAVAWLSDNRIDFR